MQITLEEMAWDDPVGARLRADQERETVERYGADLELGPKPSGGDVSVFLLAAEGRSGEPVGCGALRRLDPEAFEIKRMYVVPEWRGRRIGEVLLCALERYAADAGAVIMRLETGAEQPEAIRLYERCGYYRIDRFGHYADCAESVCYERKLIG
ncbi:GNAT family N-acetyltransferase [Nocardiopsis sp. CNT-189]